MGTAPGARLLSSHAPGTWLPGTMHISPRSDMSERGGSRKASLLRGAAVVRVLRRSTTLSSGLEGCILKVLMLSWVMVE